MKRHLAAVPLIAFASVATACAANAPIARESDGVGGAASGSGGSAGSCDVQLAQQTVQALGLTAAGPPSTFQETLPTELTGPNWGLRDITCQEGGYDLSRFAGTTVCSVMQEITSVFQGLPAEAWVLMRDGMVGCVYITLRPGSGISGGIYSVTSPNCHD
jgi:hypothetical protein